DQIDEIALLVALPAVNAGVLEGGPESGLGKASLHGNEHRLVVLVPVLVDHDEDPAKPLKDEESMAADQLGILERDVRREKRLGDAPALVHGVQAEVPSEIADEVQALTDPLRREEQTRGEKGIDSSRGRCGSHRSSPPL